MEHQTLKMKPYLIDVPVLLIFFCRDEQFRQVFEQVKIARPSKLFLYQDGPRADVPTDIEGIKRCRGIAEDIDWECEIHRLYQESNIGCDPSEYIAQRWAFDNVDRCIILEDDDVPCQSFFPFCAELLEKYKDDERINMICGMNQLGIVDNHYDYYFSEIPHIWGWASWKRVIDQWDLEYTFLDDPYTLKLLGKKKTTVLGYNVSLIDFCSKYREARTACYEPLNLASAELNNRVNIMVSKNMISNIGIASEAAHYCDSLDKLPRALRKLHFSPVYDIQGPIKHPKYLVVDKAADKAVLKIYGATGPIAKFIYNVEVLFLSIRYNGVWTTMKKVIKRLRGRVN